MILTVIAAGALVKLGLAPTQPDFQTQYEAEIVSITLPDETPHMERSTETYEVVPNSKWFRRTVKTGPESTITQYLDGKFRYETISPSGLHESQEIDEKNLEGIWNNGMQEALGMSLNELIAQFKDVKEVKKNEFKTIAGFKCQKFLAVYDLTGLHYENVRYEPVDQKIRALRPSMESYTYEVDGDSRELRRGETVISFKTGPAAK